MIELRGAYADVEQDAVGGAWSDARSAMLRSDRRDENPCTKPGELLNWARALGRDRYPPEWTRDRWPAESRCSPAPPNVPSKLAGTPTQRTTTTPA